MTTGEGFGSRLSELRSSKGLTQKEFSELIGVSRGYLASIETERQEPSYAFVKSLIDTFDVSVDGLIKGENDANNDQSFVQIPRYSVSAEAGNSGSFVSDPLDITYYAFSLQWIKRRGLDPKELQIIEVKGDSMEPKLREGDLILIDRSRVEPRDGKSFVVRVWDDLVVKHIQIIGQSAISLVSANSVYPPRELKLPLDERDFQIIGQVVASMHEW